VDVRTLLGVVLIQLATSNNVEIKIANVSQMDEEVSRFNQLVTELTGREFKLVEFKALDFIGKPFHAMHGFVKNIWNWLEYGLIVVCSLAGLAALLIAAPFIDLGIKAFGWILGRLKYLLSRLKRNRPVRRMRRKRHWDDSYVLKQDSDSEASDSMIP